MCAEINQIKFYSEKFRRALELCPKRLLSIAFQDFPHGSCGDASLLLGKYLEDSGLNDFEYVSGEFYDSDGQYRSHAWLEKENLIIDITTDQFIDRDESVFISTDKTWHERFKIKHRRPPEFDAGHLFLDYQQVSEWLENDRQRS